MSSEHVPEDNSNSQTRGQQQFAQPAFILVVLNELMGIVYCICSVLCLMIS